MFLKYSAILNKPIQWYSVKPSYEAFFCITQSCSILLTISWVSHALLEFPFIFLSFFDSPSAKFPTLAFLETGLAFCLCQSCRDRWASSLKVKVNEVLILWVWWRRTGDRLLTTAVKRALCVLWQKTPKNAWNWSNFALPSPETVRLFYFLFI